MDENEISFSYERMDTKTRFEKYAKGRYHPNDLHPMHLATNNQKCVNVKWHKRYLHM